MPKALPAWLRALLQSAMGNPWYKYTQITLEDLLLRNGIDPASRLGSVLIGQYGDSGVRPDKCSAMMHLGVMVS